VIPRERYAPYFFADLHPRKGNPLVEREEGKEEREKERRDAFMQVTQTNKANIYK
jgi:hypothetical protein